MYSSISPSLSKFSSTLLSLLVILLCRNTSIVTIIANISKTSIKTSGSSSRANERESKMPKSQRVMTACWKEMEEKKKISIQWIKGSQARGWSILSQRS
ncbi:hypothetical protein FGO68_gene13510 [Halteria grandinella]|uniref:Secreted protein n=1 Tax=Halteria grandinella TaxID=5974 RepID=A0A8J8NFM7_HALGN|nr:hypothetical protein FGO68_gene13510 [Halteria grandinella]